MWPFDAVLDAVNAIYGAIPGVLECIFYPVVVLVTIIETLANAVLGPVLSFINVLIAVPNLGIQIINLIFIGVFPSPWIALIVAGILFVFGLRLYSILKGVSIAGFSL